MPQPVITVVGPTATGKSGLSLRLAEAVGGEIVNADSMQLYRGMDIGTAKLAPAQRAGVPHHLLDVWDVTRTASVSEYQQLARAAIGEISDRGRIPILVGGSGLYVRAAIDKLEFPGTDPLLRDRLEAELAEHGAPALHARLARADPAAAAAILPGNGRRIVRALEVIELSGRPFSATLPGYESLYPAVQIGLRLPREELDRRITGRVSRMWQAGFVAEVQDLADRGLRSGRTASRALGYAQVLRFLAGEWPQEQAAAETAQATRRFARRQVRPGRAQSRPAEITPSAIAWVTAAVRSLTPSLAKDRSKCVFTVASPMNSSPPISALVRPRATSASTSVSRLDSRSRRGLRTWVTSRRATDGDSTVSPRAAARIAFASSAVGASLSR